MKKYAVFLGFVLMSIMIISQINKNYNLEEQPVAIEEKESEIETPQKNNEEIKEITDFKTYEEALEYAKKNNKNMIVVFSTEWCPGCKRLKNETLNQENVKEALKKYVFFIVNTDQSNIQKHKFNIFAIPTIIKINKNEEIIHKNVGFLPPSNFIKWLETGNANNLKKFRLSFIKNK